MVAEREIIDKILNATHNHIDEVVKEMDNHYKKVHLIDRLIIYFLFFIWIPIILYYEFLYFFKN